MRLLFMLLLISGSVFSQKGEEVPVDFPDVEARFPGGTEAMKQYIRNTVVYPDRALTKKRSGKVYLSFIIETDGSITKIKINKSSGTRVLDKEAKRVVQKMPRWRPGEAKGVKVRTRCRLPITFTIG